MPAGGQYLALARDRFRSGPDDDVHTGLGVRIAGLADLAAIRTVLQTDIRLVRCP